MDLKKDGFFDRFDLDIFTTPIVLMFSDIWLLAQPRITLFVTLLV